MNDITVLAQRIPERKRHDWSQSVMRDCDFCNQWALTVKHEDGARICASCCDAEYTSKLEVANAALVEALEARDKQNAELEQLLSDGVTEEALKLRERIAELESRTVTVKLPQRLQPAADGYDDWYVHSAEDGEYLKVDDVIAVLAAAGIQVIEGEGQ